MLCKTCGVLPTFKVYAYTGEYKKIYGGLLFKKLFCSSRETDHHVLTLVWTERVDISETKIKFFLSKTNQESRYEAVT